MNSFSEAMDEYKKQLKRGYIQVAYKGLMEFFRDLRATFKRGYPAFSMSSSIYYGYMDMTYFSIVPEFLKRRKLKIALVFIHEPFRFEVWLSGMNRKVQAKYWNVLKEIDLGEYHLASNPGTVDYVIGAVLVDKPDFRDLGTLIEQIERGVLEFTEDVEEFLSK